MSSLSDSMQVSARGRVLITLVVLVGGLVLTEAFVYRDHQHRMQEAKAVFLRRADVFLTEAKLQLGRLHHVLNGGRAAIVANPHRDRAFVRDFFEERDVPHDVKGVVGIALIEELPIEGRERFIVTVAKPELPSGATVDLTDDPLRGGVLRRVKASRRSTLSPPTPLMLDASARLGAAYVMPVYLSPGEPRPWAWLVASFVSGEFFAGPLQQIEGVADAMVLLEDQLLFDSRPTPARTPLFRSTVSVTLGDRPVRIVASSTPEFDAAVGEFGNWWWRLVGGFISLLLAALTWVLLRERDEVKRRAAELTVDLEHARTAAEVASAAKSTFLANMSHEIRTPMNGVLGMTEVLLGMELSEPQRDAARTISRSAEGLLVVVNDILDFSKLEAGRVDYERLSFDLHELLEDVAALFRGRLVGTPVHLEVELAADAPRFVWGDPSRLKQVVINLVSNAVKFTREGRIGLELGRREDRLVIAVTDTGPGIPRDRQAKLFTPFTQADTSTSRRYGGTGLGLAISRRLTEGMGGVITLESEEGHGARFELALPLEEDLARASAPARLSPVAANDATARPRRRVRVLVAEDNAVNQRIARAMLERLGCEVTFAEDGNAAVRAFEHGAYDLVFMDCQMPHRDGYEATLAIREVEQARGGRRTPIVAMTASALAEDRERSLGSGMDDHLSKPVRSRDFERAIDQWAAAA